MANEPLQAGDVYLPVVEQNNYAKDNESSAPQNYLQPLPSQNQQLDPQPMTGEPLQVSGVDLPAVEQNSYAEHNRSFAAPVMTKTSPNRTIMIAFHIILWTGLVLMLIGIPIYLWPSMIGGIVCEAIALIAFVCLLVVSLMKGLVCFRPKGTSSQPGPGGQPRSCCGPRKLAMVAIGFCPIAVALFVLFLVLFIKCHRQNPWWAHGTGYLSFNWHYDYPCGPFCHFSSSLH